MQIKHTGQPYRQMYVTDSYQRVINNIDNFGDLTGIMTAYAQESFTDAITKASANNSTVVVDKAVTISADLTVPSNVHLIVRPGGSFSVDGGMTLTINGTVDSCGQGAGTIFLGSGAVAYTTVSSLVGPFEIDMDMGENTKLIELWGSPTSLIAGSRQGALNIGITRSSAYAMTAEDGNPDCALKVTAQNRSASGIFARTRALDIKAEIRDASSSGQYVEGMQMSAMSRTGTTIVDMTVARFIIDNGGTASGNIVGVHVQHTSQSGTGTTYGILLNTSSYAITREYGIFIDSDNGSWTNAISFNGAITNVFDFEGTSGTSGAGYDASFSNPSGYVVPDGWIQIDIGGNTLYLYAYPDKPT